MFRFLLDENTHGSLAETVLDAWRRYGVKPLDMIRVGEPDAPAFGTPDRDLLLWSMHQKRLLVTYDYTTVPVFLSDHLAGGNSHPGVLLIRRHQSLSSVAESLVMISVAGSKNDYIDCCKWIPFD